MVLTLVKIKLNRIHSAFDRLSNRNKNILLVAVQEWFNLALKQIRADLTSKFIKDIATEFTNWELIKEKGEQILKPAALEIMQTGGQLSYKIMQVEGVFDILNVDAVKAAENLCAELVREVGQNTKEGIRAYISTGIKEGKSMDKVARELRPLVGLTKPQTESVINYKNLLQEKFPDLTVQDIDRKASRYAEQIHRRRADTIARTETARAQNIGYVEGLGEAGIEEAELSAYPGCCDICESMNGEKYPLVEARRKIPVHPRCRCAMLPVI